MTQAGQIIHGVTLLSDQDVYLFREGTHSRLYEKLGAHALTHQGINGVLFAVWAPNADSVYLVGDFNNWSETSHPMSARWDSSGIWEGFVPGVHKGALYKYLISSSRTNYREYKFDPFSFYSETPPKTASVVWDLDFQWTDESWRQHLPDRNGLFSPISVYEVHAGSWRRRPEEKNRFLSYTELQGYLIPYLKDMHYTHVEFLPLMEHPFYGSWGYQALGFFSPTSRYGTPQELMSLINLLHREGIGVFMDWVPAHFPSDAYGLAFYDGTSLYEHADPRQGLHPEWNSYIFNYGRNEVRSFLVSSAVFWIDRYHADGLRVDAVASMLYLDYGRPPGAWIPNRFGGKENIEAVDFLRQLNQEVSRQFPDVWMIAEESTAWPKVSRPVCDGGLGFGMKWNMGWMHDTLEYFSIDSLFRNDHHHQLTFSLAYAFHENFLLPLSHDEVVYGKRSLINKMPDDIPRKYANLRVLFGYQYAHPGKKLLFMGQEFAQKNEWNHDSSLDWHLLEVSAHEQIQHWVRDLNEFYFNEPALYDNDFMPQGFEWTECCDSKKSLISFLRRDRQEKNLVLVVCNFTPELRENYIIGIPQCGYWKERLNSDGREYGGNGHGNSGGQEAMASPCQGFPCSVALTIPPLSILFFKHTGPNI